jgi:multicomponent Na+:H+ antiporter subunit A
MLLAPLVLLVVAAAAVPFIAPALGRKTGYLLAGVFVAAFALLAQGIPAVRDNETVVETWAWVPSFGIEFSLRLNGLAMLFATLVLGVGALVLSYAPQYLDENYEHGRLFGILTVFAAAMLGLLLSNNAILLLVFWEITTLCSFLLIGGRGLKGSRPATRALFVTASGGLALLAAMVLLVNRTGTSNLTEILQQAPDVLTTADLSIIGPLIMLAAFTKSAQLPFHFWLPDAMVAITPVSAYLHAATLVKAGIYLLLLFSPLFTDVVSWHATLMTVGLATALFGAWQALRQNDLKALLAYSTVSQLGLMVALVGVGTSAALGAAALLVAAHALFKATLFMLVGIIDREAGSRDIRELSGLRKAMPITALLTGLAAMSMAGLPPLVGFVAKEEAFYAFLGTSQASWTPDAWWPGYAAAALAVLGAGLTFAYSARIISGAFTGPLLQRGLYEPRWSFLAPAAVPAVLGLVLGLAPWLLNGIVNRTVLDTGFTPTADELALWHGLSAALMLSFVAISLGAIIHLNRPRLTRIFGEDTPGPLAPKLFDRWWYATLRFGALIGQPAHVNSPGVQLAGVGVLLAALFVGAAVGLGGLGGLAPIQPGTWQTADLVVLAVLLPAVVAVAGARTPLAAMVGAGIIGLTIAIWLLLLGAPDVALTLLLVEILTVVVAAPVLAGLPRRRRSVTLAASGRRRASHLVAAVAAVVVGTAAGASVWAFTGRRGPSDAATYYLAEAEEATGGRNVVNTILVDFRGLDTLGEIVVLGAAALGLLAAPVVIRVRSGAGAGTAIPDLEAGDLGQAEQQVLRTGAVVVLPLLLVSSAVLFWRGHDEPGGGFIAGLVAGAALVVAQLSGIRVRLPSVTALVGVGLLIAVGIGLVGLMVTGSFLEPMKIPLPGDDYLTTSLIFDLGVFAVVIGLVSAALTRLVLPAVATPAEMDRAEELGAR